MFRIANVSVRVANHGGEVSKYRASAEWMDYRGIIMQTAIVEYVRVTANDVNRVHSHLFASVT